MTAPDPTLADVYSRIATQLGDGESRGYTIRAMLDAIREIAPGVWERAARDAGWVPRSPEANEGGREGSGADEKMPEASEAAIRANERARIRSLLPYNINCCDGFPAAVADLISEHGDGGTENILAARAAVIAELSQRCEAAELKLSAISGYITRLGLGTARQSGRLVASPGLMVSAADILAILEAEVVPVAGGDSEPAESTP